MAIEGSLTDVFVHWVRDIDAKLLHGTVTV